MFVKKCLICKYRKAKENLQAFQSFDPFLQTLLKVLYNGGSIIQCLYVIYIYIFLKHLTQKKNIVIAGKKKVERWDCVVPLPVQ